MPPGMIEWTIWLALGCYFLALILDLPGARSLGRRRFGRLAWTAGCVFAWAHLAAAFHGMHGWSHAHAAEATSRRTAELMGWSFGGEIYFNYAFVAVWTGDVAWRWLARQSYAERAAMISLTVHGFLLFIVVNATIVFEQGVVRVAAVVALALLAAVALYRFLRISGDRAAPASSKT
jgi:hypothetical protein